MLPLLPLLPDIFSLFCMLTICWSYFSAYGDGDADFLVLPADDPKEGQGPETVI